MNNWETEIGNLVKKTYNEQGCSDIVIAIGYLDPQKRICTQIWYPGDTADEDEDFDIRFMIFAIMNHIFTDYNNLLDNPTDSPNHE